MKERREERLERRLLDSDPYLIVDLLLTYNGCHFAQHSFTKDVLLIVITRFIRDSIWVER